VRFENTSSSAQTYLRLQSIFGYATNLTTGLSALVTQSTDATVTRPIPFDLQVSLGLVQGYELKEKFGRNPDIDTDTDPEDVWNGGGAYTGQPDGAAAETLEVFSSDANDTSAGTGARTYEITGLDGNYNELVETVTLNGTTPVTTSGSFVRAPRGRVATAGSGGTNAGTITVRMSTTTANVMQGIAAGTGQSDIACDTVPLDKQAWINRINVNMGRVNGSAGSATVYLQVRNFGTGAWNTKLNRKITNSDGIDNEFFLLVPARADIRWRVAEVSDNNTSVSGGFTYYLVDS